jgi:hypothetical protein
LKAVQVGSSGQSYFDCTTICLSTEFDRYHAQTVESPTLADQPGTPHGQTTSFILAGAGINPGIAGGVMTGPQAAYSAFASTRAYGTCLPMDLKTGAPNLNGVINGQGAVFPTVCGIFGAPVPPEQMTASQALAFAIKSS